MNSEMVERFKKTDGQSPQREEIHEFASRCRSHSLASPRCCVCRDRPRWRRPSIRTVRSGSSCRCRPAAPSTCSCAGLARSSRPAPAPASWSRTALAPTRSSPPTPARAAAPDGYTFCLLTRSTVSINPEIYRKLSYDPLKDFEPVTNGFFGQQIVILNKNVPVKTLAELVEYSKKNPDKLNFASMGLGGDSASHHGVAQA